MAKKSFSKLGLDDSLSAFVTGGKDEEESAVNPFAGKEEKKKASQAPNKTAPKKTVAKKTAQDVKPVKKAKEPTRKQPPTKPRPAQAKTQQVTAEETKAPAKTAPIEKPVVISIPDDFKSHSALFSREQLDALRDLVNFKKWKQDPKYTIQEALYEAIERLMENRKEITSYPDDFVTYSPAFSQEQWGRLESFVSELKFKQKGQYAIKYAIYEAVEMFLRANPIKF